MHARQLFLQHVAQTSLESMAFEISHAKNCTLYDVNGKEYIDLIAGISVCNIGHGNEKVVKAINAQSKQYLHTMVYGEMVQSPQVQYATWLAAHLPNTLNSTYFTSSGAEAAEGAMKLAKRVTGKHKIIACHNSYHGSTQGALSLIGSEYWRSAYRPLLPGIKHVHYNGQDAIDAIDHTTAAIFIETVQAESGITKPNLEWLQVIRKKCDDTCTLLVFDEIQAAFGRTGSLFAFEQTNVIPDVLLLGKALGGGMPLGAFIASKKMMDCLAYAPVLGHITTFGGHPVSCAAGLASAKFLVENNLYASVKEKENLFIQHLQHPNIKSIRSAGLWMAVELASFDEVKNMIQHCLSEGVFTDWFLFASNCIRIAPPLIISNEEIIKACNTIKAYFDKTN
jgi:acetylornithine/N-succinyldiaminopimelate aminotransferase